GVVDGSYFEVMGLRPALGRLLNSGDDGPSAHGAAVLTYHFWTTSLNGDPSVLGKTIRLESFAGAREAIVVGVLEPSIPYPTDTEVIANVVTSPHHLSATIATRRAHRLTEMFSPRVRARHPGSPGRKQGRFTPHASGRESSACRNWRCHRYCIRSNNVRCPCSIRVAFFSACSGSDLRFQRAMGGRRPGSRVRCSIGF